MAASYVGPLVAPVRTLGGTLVRPLPPRRRYQQRMGLGVVGRVTGWEEAPAPAHVGKRLVEGLFDIELPPTREATRVLTGATATANGEADRVTGGRNTHANFPLQGDHDRDA